MLNIVFLTDFSKTAWIINEYKAIIDFVSFDLHLKRAGKIAEAYGVKTGGVITYFTQGSDRHVPPEPHRQKMICLEKFVYYPLTCLDQKACWLFPILRKLKARTRGLEVDWL